MPGKQCLSIEKSSRCVWVDGIMRPAKLSVSEYNLLLFLASRNGEICSREETVLAVYHCKYNPEIDDGRLDALVEHARIKIEDNPHSPRFLLTVYRAGHQLLGYCGNAK
jgi:DNA-binding response OmpR family regulator